MLAWVQTRLVVDPRILSVVNNSRLCLTDESGNPLVPALNGKPRAVQLVLWQHLCLVTPKALYSLVVYQRAPFSTTRWKHHRRVIHTCCATSQLLVSITVRQAAVPLARVDWTGNENLGRDKMTRSTATLDKAFEFVEKWQREFERKLPVKTFKDYGTVVNTFIKHTALLRNPHVKVFSCFLTDTTAFPRHRRTPANTDIRHVNTPCCKLNPHRKKQPLDGDITKKHAPITWHVSRVSSQGHRSHTWQRRPSSPRACLWSSLEYPLRSGSPNPKRHSAKATKTWIELTLRRSVVNEDIRSRFSNQTHTSCQTLLLGAKQTQKNTMNSTEPTHPLHVQTDNTTPCHHQRWPTREQVLPHTINAFAIFYTTVLQRSVDCIKTYRSRTLRNVQSLWKFPGHWNIIGRPDEQRLGGKWFRHR